VSLDPREGRRLDLPLQELAKAGWYTIALYRQTPGGWQANGYTEPRWQTFSDHVDDLMKIDRRSGQSAARSWRWFNGLWYPV